ncbi:MAG: hypothetical protein WBR26_16050 [Candidatus Acidiferrum sp.]
MSTTPTVIAADQENLLQRIKSACGTGVFLLVQRSPKFLQLYRNERSWTLFRVALGCFGAALVVLPLSLWHGYFTAVFGLFVFVLSILMPPAELESATDRKAREMGAKTVVSGGEYQSLNSVASPVQLFISPTHVWALDKHYDPVVVMTTAEITQVDVVPRESRCLLMVRCGDQKVEFCYKGLFAERFARLAEESIRHALLAAKPVAFRARSARA